MFQRPAFRKIISASISASAQQPTRIATRNPPNNAIHIHNNLHLHLHRTFASLPQLIQQLRKATGAPMMECKKALNAVDNDYEKASQWLRKNGSAKAASKLAGRDASEGMVGIALSLEGTGSGTGTGAIAGASIVRVASETDFASRGKDFTKLVEIIAHACLVNAGEGGDTDGLMATTISQNDGKTVKDALDDAILAIRENLQIASAETIISSSDQSVVTGYVHGKVFNESNAGTAAAIVELVPTAESTLSKGEIEEIGKRLAMHIVAARPAYLAPGDVPAEEVEKEKQILMEQMAESGKPADILEKIVDGRMRKYYEGVCVTEQGHMLEEGNPKVSKALSLVGLKLVAFKSSFIQ